LHPSEVRQAREEKEKTMGTQLKNSDGDVVTFIKAQHAQIKRLFERVVAESGDEREQAFRSLTQLLDVHEAGEETVVHPVAMRVIAGGEAMIAARLKEEATAKKAIAQLKTLDVDSEEFDMKIRSLQSDVLAHAGNEEREELDKLAGTLDRERLLKMRKAVELAESTARDDETPLGNLERGAEPAGMRMGKT
jgi:hypothetical protein